MASLVDSVKKRKKKDSGEEDAPEETPETYAKDSGEDSGGDVSGGDLSDLLEDVDKMAAGEEEEAASDSNTPSGVEDTYPGGEDFPEKKFAEAMGVDETTGMAMYAIASSMPEYADMDPEAMAQKINGSFESLLDIMKAMGEKADLAMMEEQNAPMDMGPPMDAGMPPEGSAPPAIPGM